MQDVSFGNIVAMAPHEKTDHSDLVESPPPRVSAIRVARSEEDDHLGGDLTGSRM
jgi:hypothetical protein